MDIYHKYKTRNRNGTTSSTTTTTTTTTTPKKIQRKRKNCRRYFRHETLEMFKLGTNNKPAKKITDLESLMKPATNNPIKQLNIDNNNNNNSNNNNDNNVIDKNKQELPPICAKVPVICSSKSLPRLNNDHNVDNSGGTGSRTNKNQIQIHSVIKINPIANHQDVQSKKSSTGFMIRDLLEIEVNPPPPPPPPPLPPPPPPQSKLQPPPLLTLQSNGETIQPIQFPIIRTKPPKILNSLPPQFLPPPMPLYGQRIVRPSVSNYQQYNQKLPFLPGPSTSRSCTIDTTISTAEEKSQHSSSSYGRVPRFYERFNEPITTETSMKKSQNKPQQQQATSQEETHLVKCVLKHKVLNPKSMYFGSCHTRPLDARIPRGKLSYIREKHALLRYYDDNEMRLYLSNINNNNNNNDNNNNPTSDKRLLIQLPQEINFNTKSQLTVEEYVKEVELVERYAPCCFCQFYKYVTGYQIVNRKLPVSFLTFLSVYNTNGLEELERRYIKSLKA